MPTTVTEEDKIGMTVGFTHPVNDWKRPTDTLVTMTEEDKI